MTDIGKRLRAGGGYSMASSDMLEAANEIERLKAALEELAVLGEYGMNPDISSWKEFEAAIVRIARLALEPKLHKKGDTNGLAD